MNWGLGLSGGGTKGGAHVGVIRALEEEGLRPTHIGGASAGAVVAGLYSAGHDAQGLSEAMKELEIAGRSMLDVDFLGLIAGAFQLLTKREPSISGILKGDKLWKFFDKWTEGKPLTSARLPTVLTAVDINAPKLALFASSAPRRVDADTAYVTDALIDEGIRASIAIPSVFQPLLLDDMRLVDGGVWEAIPVQPMLDMGAERVLGINIGYDGGERPAVDNIFEIAAQSIDLMCYLIEGCRASKAAYVLNVPVAHIGVFDFDKLSEAMEIGYQTAKQHMPEIIRAMFMEPVRAGRGKEMRGAAS